MKAFTQDKYGSADVMRSRDIGRPEIGDEQVLVRVRAAGVNPADWAVMRGVPYIARPVYGLRRPKVGTRGTDVSGIVETVGSGVTRFKPGDEVFGSADAPAPRLDHSDRRHHRPDQRWRRRPNRRQHSRRPRGRYRVDARRPRDLPALVVRLCARADPIQRASAPLRPS